MSRRRYFVTYDVSDNKRRTRLFKILEGEGDHTQYSVFLCDLNHREYIRLRSEISDIINHDQDQVLFVDLGSSEKLPDAIINSIGRRYSPPVRIVVV